MKQLSLSRKWEGVSLCVCGAGSGVRGGQRQSKVTAPHLFSSKHQSFNTIDMENSLYI